MKIITSLIGFAVVLQLGCDGARVGSPKQLDEITSNEVAPNEQKLYIRDETESLVEGSTAIDGHRALKECGPNQKVFYVSFTTDDYGYETSFKVLGEFDNIVGEEPGSGGSFKDNTDYTYQYCLTSGFHYRLRFDDVKRDGFCCEHGEGTYSYGLDGEELFSSTADIFTSAAVHQFPVPLPSTSIKLGGSVGTSGSGGSSVPGRSGSLSKSIGSDTSSSFEFTDKTEDDNSNSSGSGGSGGGVNTDDAWLSAHNSRRKKYHEQWGKTYTPLKWSPGLASQAKSWANQLLNDCKDDEITHQAGINPGENMAKNVGSGSNGELKTADQILNRWVEMEMGDGWPENAHLTQALWRASKYVGCADSFKSITGPNGQDGFCRIQVCRYATAGNCNIGAYKSANGWMTPMLMDESKCGPDCSPEGWC